MGSAVVDVGHGHGRGRCPGRARRTEPPLLAESHTTCGWKRWCWGVPGTGPGSLRLAARTLGLVDRLGVPVVLTDAVPYADSGQHQIANVLDAARLLRPIDRASCTAGGGG